MLGLSKTVKGNLLVIIILLFSIQMVSAQDNISYVKNLSTLYIPNRGVQLSWNTKYNDTTSFFIIERSIDGEHFEKLGEVKAVNTETSFKFIDRNPYVDVSYYRLQVIDYDGRKHVSSLISTFIPTKGEPELVLYPMPVGNASSLNLNFQGVDKNFKASIAITDQFGRQVLTQEIEVNSLQARNSLDLNTNLPAGNYQLTVLGHSGQSFKIGKLIQITQ